MKPWPEVCEAIRIANDPVLNALLAQYYKRLFSGYATCWVLDVRRRVVRAAEKRGII